MFLSVGVEATGTRESALTHLAAERTLTCVRSLMHHKITPLTKTFITVGTSHRLGRIVRLTMSGQRGGRNCSMPAVARKRPLASMLTEVGLQIRAADEAAWTVRAEEGPLSEVRHHVSQGRGAVSKATVTDAALVWTILTTVDGEGGQTAAPQLRLAV